MKVYQYIFLLSLLTIFSCDEDFFEQVVEVDIPEHTPALAVSANFSDVDTTLAVYVSNSVGVLEPDQPVIIEDAFVEVYKDGALLYELDYNTNGLYGITNIDPIGSGGATYELKVTTHGFNDVSSTQNMPRLKPLPDD